jgi:transmembrane sensor
MNATDKQMRALLAQQASEWFVLNDAESLNSRQEGELVDWLTQSPEHVAEFLAVAAMARDLRAAGLDESSLQALVQLARADNAELVPELELGLVVGDVEDRARPWRVFTVAAVAISIVAAGLLLYGLQPWTSPPQMRPAPTEARLRTVHGEQRSWRLADHSLLHLNTDTVVTIRYTAGERFVKLESGQAAFEIAHESTRAFHVIAGGAEIIDLGTSFDVRLAGQSTVVTVIEGQVEVQPSSAPSTGAVLPTSPRKPTGVRLTANQQVSLTTGQPLTPVSVDAQRETAWLRRKIEFDHEPLERVAATINRYAAKPVLITSPELRSLAVSGAFSTDDSEELVAFLRSLDGVRVEVTERDIRVSQK